MYLDAKGNEYKFEKLVVKFYIYQKRLFSHSVSFSFTVEGTGEMSVAALGSNLLSNGQASSMSSPKEVVCAKWACIIWGIFL